MKKHDYEKKKHRDMISDIIKHEGYKIIAEIGLEKCRMTKSVLKQCDNLITEYWGIDIFESNNSHQRYDQKSPICRFTKELWMKTYLYACRLMTYFPQLHILKMSSLRAAEMFLDRYFDLVFIDSDHRYEPTLADIKAWLPKVKRGGILSGHDYAEKVTKATHHKGVTQAVDEVFGKNKIIIGEKVWVKEVKG